MAARVSGSGRGARPGADAGVRAVSAEHARLAGDAGKERGWRRWGPYLSERQWGTVREDYSAGGDAWEYLGHDQARSRAYRWGEDGLAGICDRDQRLCLALALWNGKDSILKERLFGLTNREGNHGEDVKEIYYYLDSTPTHSYMKMLYKYPQAEFPYARLVEENRHRGRGDPEFELLDTGVFDEDRYFDVFVEYAKADKADLLMAVTVHNRGPDAIRSCRPTTSTATANPSCCSATTTPIPTACTTSLRTASSRTRFMNMWLAAITLQSMDGSGAPRAHRIIG